MNRDRIKRTACWFVLGAFLFPSLALRSSAATLDDLKKLEITCFVPSHLPQGFKLKKVDITYDELHEGVDDMNHPLPLYSVEYGNGWSATFSIESAREGIGDRNIMPDATDTEETEIESPFGPMYLIYRPKGKEGRKIEIIANWVSDANMNDELPKAGITIPYSVGTTDFLRLELRSQNSRTLLDHFTPSAPRPPPSPPRRPQNNLPRLRFTRKFST